MPDGSPLLELEGVSKRFGPVQALDRVDFAVKAGEVVGLVGDNGAGKSTLVKAIAGINVVDSGKIRFDGQEVRSPSPRTRPNWGSRPSTRTWRSATTSTSSRTSSSARRRSHRGRGRSPGSSTRRGWSTPPSELLSKLAVTIPSLRSEVGTLSGGQRQQVAVARSLLGEPKVVLLDEPTAALGVAQTAQVLELIRRLRERDLGVVMISHNLVDVFEVADRIFVLRLGRAAGEFEASATTEEHVVSAITGLRGRPRSEHRPRQRRRRG